MSVPKLQLDSVYFLQNGKLFLDKNNFSFFLQNSGVNFTYFQFSSLKTFQYTQSRCTEHIYAFFAYFLAIIHPGYMTTS